LENRDYDNRQELLQQLKATFEIIQADETREPWEKYSAAVGMTIYDRNFDKSLNDVFKRADELMYKDKMESKMARN
jgi:GGDEF domain-containing protein